MNDCIFINNLQFQASIGVFDWEKQQQQTLEIDLELTTDIRKAAASEQLGDTLDYATISEQLIALAQSQHHDLIETLAERMASQLLSDYPLSSLTLTLRKPGAVPAASSVGVRITRHRQEPAGE